ncbi:MAG: deoxyribonuclease IV [Chloroflexota bacterium]|nr:deoxyribonuclease IV [Chloroflexota bacterium]
MRIGAHVSASGGLDKVIDRAVEIGAEAIQIFGSAPQSWRYKEAPEEQIASFKEQARAAGIQPVYLHAIYLINLGTPVAENLEKGVDSLVVHMTLAARLAAAGVIFHAGSHKGAGYEGIFQQTVDAIHRVLAASPEGPWLVIENSAGMGQHIGARFEEIGRILVAVDSPRVKVCLDTQHAYAAGYNLADRRGIQAALDEFDCEIGLANLVVVHANDSKTPFHSGVDRHENIGEGHIGVPGFDVIMGHPVFRDLPLLLEAPGYEGQGPDKPNVDALKQIRDRLGLVA